MGNSHHSCLTRANIVLLSKTKRSLWQVCWRWESVTLSFFAPNVNQAEKSDFLELKPFIHEQTGEKISLLAHVRCHPDDIAQAIAAGFNGLNMYIGIAERAQKYSHGYTFDHILEMVQQTIASVRTEYSDLYLRFSVEDCSARRYWIFIKRTM